MINFFGGIFKRKPHAVSDMAAKINSDSNKFTQERIDSANGANRDSGRYQAKQLRSEPLRGSSVSMMDGAVPSYDYGSSDGYGSSGSYCSSSSSSDSSSSGGDCGSSSCGCD